MKMKITQGSALVMNVPEFFADPAFMEWLNNNHTVFTWHEKGNPPNEWSDTIVLVDPSLNGEGSDSDMPDRYWDQIVRACRLVFGALPRSEGHIMVRLTNVEE